jgi:dihydrofolate synthase/folylpolyglutamate synthase
MRAAGRNPGLYTSPHLVRYQERIRIGGIPVADARLVAAFERVEAARAGVPLTYFEYGTLAALASFAEAGCDTWLLEVGLGGRLDAVNALDADVAVVTTIGLDHQEWLGDSIEAIAAEKAGIFRHGRPALYGDAPVPLAIRARAEALGADLRLQGQHFGVERAGDGSWAWYGPDGGSSPRLAGLAAPPHWTDAQFRNASVALAALAMLAVPVGLTAELLNPVLCRSAPPGRFQRVQREQEWVLDVAHNPQAAGVLRQQLGTLPAPPARPGALTVVLALLADKAAAGFVRELRDLPARWIVSGVEDPRASSEERMRGALAEAGIADAAWAASPAAAFEMARRLTPAGGRILVCGSFRIVAPALEWLGLY